MTSSAVTPRCVYGMWAVQLGIALASLQLPGHASDACPTHTPVMVLLERNWLFVFAYAGEDCVPPRVCGARSSLVGVTWTGPRWTR